MSTKQPRSALLSLQDRVARIYYTHGLFCSTHPIPVITFALIIILLCCYPFINVPLPGNVPQEYITPFKTYSLPPGKADPSLGISQGRENDGSFKPRWYHGPPVGYIQQILVRTTISPWTDDLMFIDAFKAPLSKAFDLVEIVQNYQYDNGNGTMAIDDLCLHISEAMVKPLKEHLPTYGCLLVSPANVWKKDIQKFLGDPDLIHSVLSLGRKTADTSAGLNDILFGVPWTETSIKKIYIRNRPRVVTYAITLIFNKYDSNFLQSLEERLHHSFSFLHINESVASGNITHIHFHSQYSLVEFVPLFVTYVILFLYIYFSVRKIEMVKSKVGMAFSAVVTVVASLCMSVGLCTWFGLSFTIKAGQVYLKDIFPYLVVIIGLENILVLTKSVVSTPANLDVKVRLAQGLSKEGWSITKNLVTELSILTFGFFTFVPAIQEFCFFAVVGLLSDFFLQLVFFATILAVDIGRMEMSDLQRQCLNQSTSDEELAHMYPLFRWPLISRWQRQEYNSRISSEPQPSPILTPASHNSPYPANFVAPPYSSSKKGPLAKVPKRLRLVYFWARCRIFQKAFMISFLVWVALIVYKSGIVALFTVENSTQASENHSSIDSLFSLPLVENSSETFPSPAAKNNIEIPITSTILPKSEQSPKGKVDAVNGLKHRNYDLWRHLLYDHWPTLFGFYNISLNGRYISILPPIKLSIPIVPEEAIRLRQSSEFETSSNVHWLSSANSKSSQYSDTDDIGSDDSPLLSHVTRAYYPSSPIEVLFTAILAIPSVVFLVYVMVVLYQCICSRNYAEWRSSWSQESSQTDGDIFTQLVIEAMPVVLEGHPQEVECLATDENFVVSSCLAGEIRVWDSTSGECLNVINRKKYVQMQKYLSNKDVSLEVGEDFPSDYESGSPPSCSDSYMDQHHKKSLTSTLSSNSADADERPHSYPSTTKSLGNTNRMTHLSRNYSSEDLNNYAVPLDAKLSKRDLFKYQPDLTTTINTDFTVLNNGSSNLSKQSNLKTSSELSCVDEGYDFGHFQIYYDEHQQIMAEEKDDLFSQKQTNIQRNNGELSPSMPHSPNLGETSATTKLELDDCFVPTSSVWCIDCKDNVIVVGCSDGKIEFWDTLSGTLKYIYDESTKHGVTGVRISGTRIIAVRIHGAIDFLELGFAQPIEQLYSSQAVSMHRRTHNFSETEPLRGDANTIVWGDNVTCHRLQTTRAHQQPITVLEVEGGKAVTGSQDHTLKVFRVEDAMCLSTLHGHYGPITTLFIDKFSPMTAASGSQDGAVCLWDLQTGTCICRLRGHDGSVTALSYTASYVLSAGTDNKLFVWERFQGHLLNTINLQQSHCGNIIMLTDNLLLTGQQGSLGIWDIRLGDPVRIVRLGHTDESILVRQIRHVGHTIVCDYGRQLRVVRFPAIVEKVD